MVVTASQRHSLMRARPKAAAVTIRKEFGQYIEKNAVHGSDASETAATEIAFYFKPEEIF